MDAVSRLAADLGVARGVIAKGKYAKAIVWRGDKEKTSGGLTKTDLVKNPKSGRIVSTRRYAAGKKAYVHIQLWTKAVQKARAARGVRGFQAVMKGSHLYEKAMAIYGALKYGGTDSESTDPSPDGDGSVE